MDREDALNANSFRDFSYGDGGRYPPAVLARNYQALKGLDAFLIPFFDFL